MHYRFATIESIYSDKHSDAKRDGGRCGLALKVELAASRPIPSHPVSCEEEVDWMSDPRSKIKETSALLLLNSVQGSRAHTRPKNEPERAQLYKTVNSNIIAILSAQRQQHAVRSQGSQCDDSEMNMLYISDNLGELVLDYVWLTRCCSNATEIADTFNSNHLVGLLVCKSLSLLFSDMHSSDSITVASFFPSYPTIHVCPTNISEMRYSELVFVVTSLQQKWDLLITMDITASAHVLASCMARFGHLASMQMSSQILDDTQEREHVNAAAAGGGADSDIRTSTTVNTLWVLSKRAIRHFASTFVCMAREISILHASSAILVRCMSDADYSKFITDEVMAYGFKLAPDISDKIRSCFGKIKGLRQSELQQDTSDAMGAPGVADAAKKDEIPSAEKNWEFLMKKLGPHKLGPRPRKMNAEFNTLLGDVIVALSETYNHVENTTVTRSCLNIIQTALKYYYVVPSAERYREIVLMQNLCPGQRLNYAFDYMHFDTGGPSRPTCWFLQVHAPKKSGSLCFYRCVGVSEANIRRCAYPCARPAITGNLSSQSAVQARRSSKYDFGLARRFAGRAHCSVSTAHH